jgi:hypothetical protein
VQASIGEMSCNPSIGGLAKGTLVREVDVRTQPRTHAMVKHHFSDREEPCSLGRWLGSFYGWKPNDDEAEGGSSRYRCCAGVLAGQLLTWRAADGTGCT